MAESVCPHCGKEIYDDEALLCLYCGRSLERSVGFIGGMKYLRPGIFAVLIAVIVIAVFIVFSAR